MKKLNCFFLIIVFFSCNITLSFAIEYTEKITKKLRFEKVNEKNLLLLKNINGSVNVEGYSGDQVLVEVEKIIRADSNKDLEEGKNDIRLGIIETGDSIILYVDSPYSILKRKHGKISYHWDWDDSDYNYDFRLNFTIKVPYGTTLKVSTINNGDVSINDPRARVYAGNVNGSIYLKDISGVTKANTVNGKIEANYTRNPEGDCSYSTVNGDITLIFLSDLSADVTYKTLNGDFYTNFNNIEYLANKVERVKKETEKGTSYKIEKNPAFRIGKGNIQLKFKTINGDMIIKKLR